MPNAARCARANDRVGKLRICERPLDHAYALRRRVVEEAVDANGVLCHRRAVKGHVRRVVRRVHADCRRREHDSHTIRREQMRNVNRPHAPRFHLARKVGEREFVGRLPERGRYPCAHLGRERLQHHPAAREPAVPGCELSDVRHDGR